MNDPCFVAAPKFNFLDSTWPRTRNLPSMLTFFPLILLPVLVSAVGASPSSAASAKPEFNWTQTKYFYAFGDSYTFVQGTKGHANFRSVSRLQTPPTSLLITSQLHRRRPQLLIYAPAASCRRSYTQERKREEYTSKKGPFTFFPCFRQARTAQTGSVHPV